jgi:hypothetical protein
MPQIHQLQPVTAVADAMRVEVASTADKKDVDQAITLAALKAGLQALTDTLYLPLTGGALTGDLQVPTKTPAAANAAGVTGTITWDASYLYVCINTNTWVRVAIATWP